MQKTMSDNIDQLPEEGSAYLKPSTPAVKEEERSDAVEFAEWARENSWFKTFNNTNKWYDHKNNKWLTTQELYQLFKTRNK